MIDGPFIERRNNPSRKREIHFDVAYRVLWNQHRHGFDVYRGEESTGAFAADKATAIGLAIRSAQQEDEGLKVSVSAIQNGTLTVEWSRQAR